MNWKKQAGMHLTWLIPQTKAVPLAGPPQPAGPSSGNLSVSRTFAFPSAELIIQLAPASRSGSVITIAYQHTRAFTDFTEASESGAACLGVGGTGRSQMQSRGFPSLWKPQNHVSLVALE